jgi:hypothetical protein
MAPPVDLTIRTRRFALAVRNFVRLLPCADHLEYLNDTRIGQNAALLQEARELAKIFAKSVSTARKNTERMKKNPKS